MREIRSGSEYAIVAQFIYTTADPATRRLESAKQYDLFPGEGIIFLCDRGNNPVGEVPFTQDRSDIVLDTLQGRSSVQMIALHEETLGGLLFTTGSREQTFGIGYGSPHRTMSIHNGRVAYSGIWGPTKEEAERTFRQLQEMQRRLN